MTLVFYTFILLHKIVAVLHLIIELQQQNYAKHWLPADASSPCDAGRAAAAASTGQA